MKISIKARFIDRIVVTKFSHQQKEKDMQDNGSYRYDHVQTHGTITVVPDNLMISGTALVSGDISKQKFEEYCAKTGFDAHQHYQHRDK